MANTRKKQAGKASAPGAATINELLAKQRIYFDKQVTKPLSWRTKVVSRFGNLMKLYEDKLAQAVSDDLHISRYEAYFSEVAPLFDDLAMLQDKLGDWTDNAADRHAPSKLKGLRYSTYWQPLGRVCVINDWRSPVLGLLQPTIYALAAGCTVIAKNSDRTPACNKVIADALGELFLPDYVSLLTGNDELDLALVNARFEKVFYNGLASNAAAIREAAAKTATPLTMLLDGNNPCFVDGTFDLAACAERIMWGKMLLAGQGRLAPSWVLCAENHYKSFINRTFEYVKKVYGDTPLESKNLPRLFSRREYDRAVDYLEHLGAKGEVIYGGQHNPDTLKIEPTVVLLKSMDTDFLKRRITGPILTVVPYALAEDALNDINKTGMPPAFYVFSTNKVAVNYAINYVGFATAAICDTVIQTADPNLPTAALGSCGMAQFGGFDGLKEFGILKAVAEAGSKRAMDWRFAPFPDSYDNVKKLYGFKGRA